MIYYFIVLAVVVCDRIVKGMVVSDMMPYESNPVIANVFHITYVQNTGAAFSMWENQWILIVLLPSIALAVGLVLLFIKKKCWSSTMLIAISFICGGGLGNLIDRIGMGYVVDMFDFRVFPVFNIADIFVCVGCGLLLLDILLSERKKKKDDSK